MTVKPRGVVTGRIGEAPHQAVSQPDPIILPDPPALFARRALRLDALAGEHPLVDWLRFMARLAGAHEVAAREATPPVPADVQAAVAAGVPPLAPDSHPRDAAWRAALAAVLSMPDGATLPSETQAIIHRLRSADSGTL